MWNMANANPYVKSLYKKSLLAVRSHWVIYVPKLLVPLTVEDLAAKRLSEAAGRILPRFLSRGELKLGSQAGYDPT